MPKCVKTNSSSFFVDAMHLFDIYCDVAALLILRVSLKKAVEQCGDPF